MKLSKDKIKHFILSFLMVVLISLPLYYYTQNIQVIGIGMIVSLTVGVIKEFIYDYWLGKGQLSIYDLAYNFIGVYFGAIATAIIIHNV